MFNVDYWNNPEPLQIYIVRPDGSIICNLNSYIDEDDSSLTLGVNQQYELSFSVILTDDDSEIGDYLQEGMQLLVDKIGFFKMSQPSSSYDGVKEIKSISALSCDSELEDKNVTLEINQGTETSAEYLVKYDPERHAKTLLADPYTNIPYDWIMLYNTFPEQLEEVKDKFDNGYYGNIESDGSVYVTDGGKIQELLDLFSLIPRVRSRLNPNENDSSRYNLIEYAVTEVDSQGETIAILLKAHDYVTDHSSFRERIEQEIVFYTMYRDQLSLISLVLENTGGDWTISADDIYGVSDGDYSIANLKCQFEIDSTIYAFLTQDLAQATNCVVNFDIINRKVKVTPVDHVGEDTGIVMSYDNLVNTLNIESQEDKIATRLYVTGGEELGIEQVNFGLPWVDDITYKLNARDSKGSRIYVTDELAEKYLDFIEHRENLRRQYIQLSKDYRNYLKEIYEIQYRVPNDGLATDWGTFTLDELEAELATYNNQLTSLIALYKEDYYPIGFNQDDSVNENYIKGTMYWYDYDAYKNIIDEIECAIAVFPYYSDQSKWTQEEIDEYKDVISAWETEWTLYGTIELKAKMDAYKTNMDILVENKSVFIDGTGAAIPWGSLTPAQQAEVGGLEANYKYDEYSEYRALYLSAGEYYDTLETQLEDIQNDMDESETDRAEIAESAHIDNADNFTDAERKIIYRLFRDADYSNENILFTSDNTSDEELDIAYELLLDAQSRAFISGRPQLAFSIEADNLLGLSEFERFWGKFVPGNYMLIQYKDDAYLRLRMISYEFNPLLPSRTNITVTFSNVLKSRAGVSDIESLLGFSNGTGNTANRPSIASITELYALSKTDAAPSDSEFSESPKRPTSTYKYLWNYELITYTDGSMKKSGKHIAGVYGDEGNGIERVDEFYALSMNDTAPADSNFGSEVLSPTPILKYLWNYELTTYKDGTQKKSDKRIMAVYGDEGAQGATGATGDDGISPIEVLIDSSAGVLFKNNQVSTTLTVTIKQGTVTVTNSTGLHNEYGASAYLQWYEKGIRDSDFSEISSSDSRLSNNGFSLTVTSADVDTKVIYRCELVTG